MTSTTHSAAARGKVAATARKASLTPKQARFVAEYVVDLNASAAARRSGYRGDANTVGPRLLANVGIQAAIAAAQARVAATLEVSAGRVVSEAWRIFTADARELVEYHVGSCRYCWGLDFRYQRTAAEMELDLSDDPGGRRSDTPGDRRAEQGGIGFNAKRAPNANCPECFGMGQGRTYVKDTRTLSPRAVALYAGIKQTKDSLEVKMHSKTDALEKLFRHLGLYDRLKLDDETINLLKADSGLSLADRGRVVLAATATGSVPTSQAAQLLGALGTLAKLIETDELERRIAAIEADQEGARQ